MALMTLMMRNTLAILMLFDQDINSIARRILTHGARRERGNTHRRGEGEGSIIVAAAAAAAIAAATFCKRKNNINKKIYNNI